MGDQPRDDNEPNSEPDVIPPAPPELAASPVAPPPPAGDAHPAPPAPGAATPPAPGAATPPAPPIVPGSSASTDAPQAPATEASGVAARAWFAPFTPSVLLGGLAHVGVTVGAAFLGALALLCVLLTLGSAGSTPVGDVSDLLDGAGTLVGLVFTLMAFILGGEITARASGDAGFFSAMGAMSLWMFPLLITAAVLVVVLWWGVRQERLHPLPTRLHRLGWAATVGLVTGLVLLVLALIFAVRGGGSGFGIELSAAGFRVVLFSLLLVGAAAYLGRQAGALAQPGEIWASATRRLVQRAPRVVREWLSYVAFGTALFAVLGAINLVVAMWDANGAASIGAALVMMLNIAPFAAAVGHLGGVSGSGGIGELISSKTITVFNGGDPLLWIAVVGAVLLTAFTALWIGTRRPRTDRIVWGTAWQLPVIVFGAWLILGSLFFGIGIGVSGSFGGGLGGSFGGGLGVALWSSFVFLIWAVLVELGAQTLPRLVYGSMPEVHRALAGKSAVAAWVAGTTAVTGTAAVSTATATGAAPAPPLAEPKPLSPAAKRGLIIGLSSVGAVVVLLIAGMIAVGVVNSSRTPAAVAEQYLGHLAAGRASEANALVDPDVPNAQRGLLTDEVLGAASERITDITVHDDEGDGDSRVVAVSYKLDGVTHEDYLEARKGEPEWLVLDTWTLTSSLAAPVSIWSQTGATLSIGGAEFEAVAQDQTEIVLYPGVYELELADTTYFGLDDTTLLVARDTMSSKELVLRPTDALNDEVRAQIGAVLDECLASTDPDPDGCPFRVYTYNDDTEVTWTMPAEPSVEIGEDGASVMVEGTVVGSFSEEFFGTVREDDAEDTFSMYGELTITDGTVTVEFDDGWW